MFDKCCKSCGLKKPRIDFPKYGGRVCKTCVNIKSRINGNTINPLTGLTKYQEYSLRSIKHQQRKEYRHKLKIEVLLHYGDGKLQCTCCGENELSFLDIDHIEPVGRADINGNDKQGRPRGGKKLYAWLRRNNYPLGFRTLCHNCNIGRQINNGICPHEITNAKVA